MNTVRLLQDALLLIREGENKKAAELLAASGDESPLVLEQTAVCLMEALEFTKAEQVLKKLITAAPSDDAYELMNTLWLLNDACDFPFETYRDILHKNPDDERAAVYFTAMHDKRDIDMFALKIIEKCAEDILSGIIFKEAYPETVIIRALSTGCKAAQKANLTILQLRCFVMLHKILPQEAKRAGAYRSLLDNIFSVMLYEYFFKAEEQTALMREIYELYKPTNVNAFTRKPRGELEMRVGFLSSNLCFNPVGRFVLSLFTDCNKNANITYYCYDTRTPPKKDDEITAAFKQCAGVFRYIGDLTDILDERVILKDNIDILFDLDGLSVNSKRSLVARRLAPIQFNWIGFPCTSALPNVDYTIVDPVTDPPGHQERFYTEQLVYMQKTFLCYPFLYDETCMPVFDEPPVVKNKYITFGSFCNAKKYSVKTLEVWTRLMRRIPNARLYVMCVTALSDVSRYGLYKQFNKSGIDMTRVDFAEPGTFAYYLSSYNNVDIVLDTFPFNGATTTCDAFMMGVPVVSLTGNKHCERVGLAFLNHVGLADLACDNTEEYIETAVRLAEDIPRLKVLKQTLHDTFKNSALCDTQSFKDELETHLRRLFTECCM